MKFLNVLALLGAVVLLAACGSVPERPASEQRQSTDACAGAPRTLLTPASQVEACRKLRQDALTALQRVKMQAVVHPAVAEASVAVVQPQPAETSLYFDLDQAGLGKDADNLLQAHAKYLASHPALMLRIEGNCDERGTDAYNMRLGQKRAAAVMAAMKNHGVEESKMTTVSLGKERPKHAGHGAEVWGLNRRVDLVYLRP